MKTMRFLAFFLSLQLLGTAQKTTTYIAHYREPFPGPQAYKNPKSACCFWWKVTAGIWRQSLPPEICCGTEIRSRMCHSTGSRIRKLFFWGRPQNGPTASREGRMTSLRLASPILSLAAQNE